MDRYHTGLARFIAVWIDGLVISAITGVISFLIGLDLGAVINLPLSVANASAGVAYSVYMHGRFGQTLGKFFVRVRVVGLDERRISYEQAALREIVPLIVLPVSIWVHAYVALNKNLPSPALYSWVYSLALIWVVLELVTMLLNEQRRAFHDFIAKTVVVRVP